MQIVVVPPAPLLIPELTGPLPGSPVGKDVEQVRSAVRSAVSTLTTGEPAVTVLVGPGPRTRRHSPSAWGTLAGLGTAVRSPAHGGRGRPRLSAAMTIGRWLLESAGADRARGVIVMQEVAVDTDPPHSAELGLALAAGYPAAAWLVLADGSTTRTARGPGAFDPRGAELDAALAAALAGGDPAALLRVPPQDAAAVGATGVSCLQVMAGTVSGVESASLDYDGAPFGVGYLVARWTATARAVGRDRPAPR